MTGRTYFIPTRLLLLLATALASPLSGQPQAETKEEAPKSIYTIHLLYMPTKDAADTTSVDYGLSLKFETEGEVYQVNALPGSLTRAIKYVGPPTFVLFEEIAGTDSEMARKPVVTAKLGLPGTKIIVLYKTSPTNVSARIMDVNRANFPDNTVRIANFSKQLIHAKIDDVVRELKSLTVKDFSLKNDAARFLVRLAIAGHNGEELYLIEKRRMAMRNGNRKLILLYHNTTDPNEVVYSTFEIPAVTEVVNHSDDDIEKLDPRFLQEAGIGAQTEE